MHALSCSHRSVGTALHLVLCIWCSASGALHLVLCMGQGIMYYHSGSAQAVTCSDRIISGHLESGLFQ